MKREYSKPSMDIEMFEANEYIAACKPINEPGILYLEENGVPGYQKGSVRPYLKGDVLLEKNIAYTEPPCNDYVLIQREAKFQVNNNIYDVTYHYHILSNGKEKRHITGFKAVNAS